MSNATNPENGNGAVAMFRWFSDGENWAYHPWYATRRLELVQALDSPLKQRNDKEFVMQALGGYLVGELVPDRDCPDPRAVGRSPCILRVAFLRRRPTEEGKTMLMQSLRKIAGIGPGVDSRLFVTPPSTPEEPDANSPKRNRRAGLIGVAIALLFLGGVYFIIDGFGGSQNPKGDGQKSTEDEVIGRVKYKLEEHPGEQPAIIDPEVWTQVQALLRRNGRTGGLEVRNRFGFTLSPFRSVACRESLG